MIGRIRGELLEASAGIALVEACGVGYEVVVPDSVFLTLPSPGGFVDLRIRQVIREDSSTLYGFAEPFQRKMFDLLLEVKGCGPRIALALLGQVGEQAVAAAIVAEDARALSRATGVGAKLADRIVLELKAKVQEEAFLRKVESGASARSAAVAAREDQLVDALLALGYRRPEAESAAAVAREEAETVEEQLRAALRTLAR